MGRRWLGAVVTIAIFAALWETRDHTVPASKEEWQSLLVHWVTPSEQVIHHLTTMRETFREMVQSARPFAIAICKLLYMLVAPVLIGLYSILVKAALGFYEYVVIRLICSPTTIRNVKYCIQTAIQWQMNRTKREIAIEVAIVSSSISIYYLIRFLNRRRYLERSKAWIRRKRRRLQMRYQAFLQNLASVNRKLAIMAPHVIFAIGVLAFECCFFSLGRYLVEQTPITAMVSTFKPVIVSILLVYQLWNDQQMVANKRKELVKKKSKRRSIAGEFQPTHLMVHQQDLLYYLVVRGSLAAAKKAYLLLPFASSFIRSHTLIISLLCKLEFWFWVWVNAMPYLTLASIAVDYPNPVVWLVENVIKQFAVNLQQGVSMDFPQVKSFWENTVMVAAPTFLRSLTWISILNKDTAEYLIHLTAQGRTFVAPFLLVMIYPLRGFGVLCVSHLLPISGSLTCELTATDASPRTAYHWLQTWVLHVALSCLLDIFAPLLWWLPFSNVFIFSAHVLLSISPPTTIDNFYRSYVQEELQVWHVLPPGELEKQSYIANFIDWLIERLPKAADVEKYSTNSNGLGTSVGEEKVPGAATPAKDPEPLSEKENNEPVPSKQSSTPLTLRQRRRVKTNT